MFFLGGVGLGGGGGVRVDGCELRSEAFVKIQKKNGGGGGGVRSGGGGGGGAGVGLWGSGWM